MTAYDVHVTVEQVYRIEADNPEEAAYWVESGDSSVQPQTIGAWVEAVRPPDEPLAVDLRQQGHCATHNRAFRPGGECRRCYLDRVMGA